MSNNNILYHCSMHKDVTSDKPGVCPKCGMTLVPAKDSQKKPKGCECCR